MAGIRTGAVRTAKVVAVCVAAIAMTISPANAAVTTFVSGGTSLFVASDAAGDTMVLGCSAGHVTLNGVATAPTTIDCGATQLIT